MSAEPLELCDVRRYDTAHYYQHSPLPTHMPITLPDTTTPAPATLAEMYGAQLERMKRALHRTDKNKETNGQTDNSPTSMVMMNGNEEQSGVMQEAQAVSDMTKLHYTDTDIDSEAAAQELVTAFLLEGSAQMGYKTYSGYPIYGSRSAEQRLQALRGLFTDALHVKTHTPVHNTTMVKKNGSAVVQNTLTQRYTSEDEVCCNKTTRTAKCEKCCDDEMRETREQYWRRLARHYITQPHNDEKEAENTAAGVGMTLDKSSEATPLPTKNITTTTTINNGKQTPCYEPEDSFYLIDLGRVVEQMARWRRALPMVRPHYAVKCNPNLAIMQTLAALGAGFDCASKAEIELVIANHLVASPDEIIFANPCKQPGDLRAAASHYGVTYVTFDSTAELAKIAHYMPNARAILRISTNDAHAVCAFSSKFGAPLEQVPELLRTARALGLEIYGVSFHVGSGNNDTAAYVQAVRDAHWVFAQAADHGFNCTLLDIGGGYPGVPPTHNNNSDGEERGIGFEEIAAALRPVLTELFPDTTIIAEPGRFFTAATHALVMNVFGKRVLKMSEAEKVHYQSCYPQVSLDAAEEHQYYVNDGLYHSFNCVLYDHAHPTLLLLDDGDGAQTSEISAMEQDAKKSNNKQVVEEEVEKEENVLCEGVKAEVCTPHIAMTTTVTPQSPASPSSTSGFFTTTTTNTTTVQRHIDPTTARNNNNNDDDDSDSIVTVRDRHGGDDCLLRDPWCRRRLCPPRPLRLTTIFGPTCDSLDCILKKAPFPEMHIGDWLLVPDMGSYTTAAGCAFNGFATRRVEWVSSIVL